ncbi:hematopoietic progenitor cell antigen CD34 [Centroberyx affinis]|uniref:hematopoietic progenitor cell antigen CD34 n=1 Tax=Centroberyx affinis TaxID=166261 RepID=UPI003A5B9B66
MAASMWRMNGLWRGMAVALLLCALLLNNGVMCQDDDAGTDATVSPAADPGAPDSAADPGATVSPADADATAAPDAGAPADDAAVTMPVSADSAATVAPGDGSFHVSILTAVPNADSLVGAETSGTSGTTVAPSAMEALVTDAPAVVPHRPQLVVPDVKCVEAIAENNAVEARVKTNDCEATKSLIQSIPAAWCDLDTCRLDVSQNDNTIKMSSPDAKLSNLAKVLQSENMTALLGVSDVKTPPSSSGSPVFVAVLLTGLLLAAALIGGYCLKTRRGSDAKGIRLAEETYPVDEENQGNTLVSVAPLNPPPETQEKPSVNGESPEPAKTQPPPTNGHSTAKTADTEL